MEILYALTRSSDRSEDILKSLNCKYKVIELSDFSHRKTREMMLSKATGNIIVFISQDIKMKNNLWLNNLNIPIIDDECEASFSKQIGEDNSVFRCIISGKHKNI